MNSPPSPSLAFTSRDLFLGVALVGVLLGVFSTFGMFFAAPLALVIAIGLFYYGHRQQRRPYIWAARSLMLPAACLTAIVLFGRVFFGAGPIYSRAKWPTLVSEIATAAGADLDGVRVSCLGAFLDEEYVWRQRVPRENLEMLIAKLELAEQQAAQAETYRYQVPYLWRPTKKPENRYFTGYLDEGETVMIHDPTTEWLHVYYHWDF